MLNKTKAYIESRKQALVASRGDTKPGVRDRGPIAIGRLMVQTRAVDPTTGAKGEWETKVDDSNLVVTQAENLMAQMAIGATNSALNYIELGNPPFPANPPQLTDLGLQASTGVRMALSPLTASGNVVTAVADFGTAVGNGFTYTEAGLFTGPFGAGLMFARKTFQGITKTNSFEMKFTWFITFLVNTTGGECAGISLIGPSTVSALTIYNAAGGEASVAATFDFAVNANNVDVFLNGQRLYPGVQYQEAAAGSLNAPVGGPAGNKGVNFIGFTLQGPVGPTPGDSVLLIQRTQV